MQGTRQPIVLIYQRPHKTEFYPSVSEAAKKTGIPRKSILRGLKDPDGWIPNTRPIIFVEEAVVPADDDISL